MRAVGLKKPVMNVEEDLCGQLQVIAEKLGTTVSAGDIVDCYWWKNTAVFKFSNMFAKKTHEEEKIAERKWASRCLL